MKKILIFFLLLLLPLNIKAYYCNYEDYKTEQKKASNVNLMLDYEIKNEKAIFTITLYNLKEEHYLIDSKETIYEYNGTDTLEIKVEKPGSYSFEVYSEDNYCDENYLNKLYVEIPTYNKYYKDELCKGVENFKYCQKWFGANITYNEFKKAVNDYKESLKVIVEPEPTYKSIFDYLLEFYVSYWFIILPTIIVVCIIGIILKKKQENKFNL